MGEFSQFQNFMQLARQNFDYVIIDSAPFLSVSDSSLLAQMSDVSFLTVRNGVTKPQELRLGVEISTQIGTLFDGIIYNCFEKPKGYFGYYQYYGNYEYQYYADKYLYKSYEYESNK